MATTIAPSYTTEIRIWSRIGHCPLTNRKGAFCDELIKKQIQCDSPTSAKKHVQELLKNTPNADKGYFYVTEYPNQNIRTGWIS